MLANQPSYSICGKDLKRLQELPDEDLMLLIQSGDQEAFNVIFNKYFPKLCLQCSHILGDSDLAEDLAQETLFKMYQVAGKYNSQYKLYTWLSRMARNKCIDHFRKLHVKKEQAEDPNVLDAQIPTLVLDPLLELLEAEAMVTSQARTRVVRECVAQLPQKEATIIELRLDGRTYDQIATDLGKPSGTVKTITLRAKNRLRKILLESELFSPLAQ